MHVRHIHPITLKPHYFLYLLAVTLPLSAFPFFNFKTRAITWDWIVMTSLIFICFAEGLLGKQAKLPKTNLLFWIILFNIFLLLSVIGPFFSGEISRLIDYVTTWFQYVLFMLGFLVVLTFRVQPSFVRSLLRWYLLIAATIALFGLIQVVAAWMFNMDLYPELSHIKFTKSETGYENYLGGLTRATSIFEEPRRFGAFLVIPFFLALLCLRRGQTKVFKIRCIPWGMCLLFITGILISFSISAYVGLAIGTILTSIIFFTRWRDTTRMYAWLFVGSIVFVIVIQNMFHVNVSEYLAHRLYAFNYGSEIWQFNYEIGGVARYIRGALLGVKILTKNPIFGIGLNQFRSLNPHGYEWVRILPPFELLASIGILGSISFACFFFVLIGKAWRLRRYIGRYFRFEIDSALILVSVTLLLTLGGSGYNYHSSLFWFPIYAAALIVINVHHWYNNLEHKNERK